jgi:hypothetical protein
VLQSTLKDAAPELSLLGQPLHVIQDDDERPICAGEDLQKTLCPSPVKA